MQNFIAFLDLLSKASKSWFCNFKLKQFFCKTYIMLEILNKIKVVTRDIYINFTFFLYVF